MPAPKDDGSNGWNEWSRHVLAELRRLNDWCERLTETQQKILTEIATLKVKAGVWGAIAGLIPVVITIVVWWIVEGKK